MTAFGGQARELLRYCSKLGNAKTAGVRSGFLLALSLGLGKAPIRAALARLAQDGLVAAIARRGWRVAPVTLADVLDVFRLRRSLEPLAARLAAERGIDAALLKRLDAAITAYDRAIGLATN